METRFKSVLGPGDDSETRAAKTFFLHPSAASTAPVNGSCFARVDETPPTALEPIWKRQVVAAVKEEGLVEYRPSIEGVLGSNPAKKPDAVFLGMGVCTKQQVSVALPLDALGMLLPAEQIRRVLGARSVIVLIADEHARSNFGFSAAEIERITSANEDVLTRVINAFGLGAVKVVRASDFHSTAEYLEVLAEVDRRAKGLEHAYFRKEVADIEFLNRVCGGILKVGWTVSSSLNVERRHDEVAFDQRFRAWMGDHVPFIYCKAGRVLDERRPKASPYVATEESRRLCLHQGEDVRAKLRAVQSTVPQSVLKSTKRHLGALIRSFCAVVEPLSGQVEDRAQEIIGRVFGPAPQHALEAK